MRIPAAGDGRLLNQTLCCSLDAAGYTADGALAKQAAISFLKKPDYDLIFFPGRNT